MFNKIDPYLQQLVNVCSSKNKELDCLVYTNNVNYLKKYFVYNNLCEIIAVYPFISAVGIKINNKNIFKIARLNMVSYITASTKVSCLVHNSKKLLRLDSELKVNNSFSCVVIDTGVSPTIDICMPENKIIYFKDFVNNRRLPYDDNGHGTMVASALTGSGLVSNGKYSGIVNNQKLIVLKALNQNGETDAFTILDAFEWVYKNQKKYNIKVVCMSFGSNVLGKNDPLILGAEALWDKGITVVVAAGNSGPELETIKSPGASSKLITVGAIDTSKFDIADFSSRGPILNNYKPDIVAPGVDIVAGCNFKLNGKHYDKMTGTSIATPMIAGLVCYLLSINPKFTPNGVKSFLISNCIQITGDRNKEGFGYFNGDILK